MDDVKIKAALQGDHVELLLRLDHEHFLETLGPGKGVTDRNGSERWRRAELEHADDAFGGAAFKVEPALAHRYCAYDFFRHVPVEILSSNVVFVARPFFTVDATVPDDRGVGLD